MARTPSHRTPLRPQMLTGVAAMLVASLLLVACRRQPPAPAPVTPTAAATAALPQVPLVSEDGKAAFAGSEACRSCHQDQFRQHLLTTHATTLHAIEPGGRFSGMFKTAQTIDDPALGVTFSLAVRDGQPYFRARRRIDGQVEEAKPAYAIGSGRMGYTFLLEREGAFFESRLSYFPKSKTWYWTAGQKVAEPDQPLLGRVMDAQRTRECFLCHSTAVVHQDGLVDAEKSMFNVGCERCHGPGKQHVEEAKQGKPEPLGPQYGKVSADSVVALCKNCHAKPGDSGTVSAMDGSLPRFAGTAFVQSKCFTESGGRLSCVTCHEPHQPLKKTPATYERVCLSCHTAPEPNGVCPIEPKSGCVDCHMPLQAAGLPLNFKFHNHWIKSRYPRVITAE